MINRFKKIYRTVFYIFLPRVLACVAKEKSTQPLQYLADGDRPTFFGYHDKTPFSHDGTKILAMSIAASDTRPDSECSEMRLGYFEKADRGFADRFVPFSTTTTWCWQQGCMLQWLPDRENQAIFNDLVEGSYGSKVFDLITNSVVKSYRSPVYAISPTGRLATTLNFSRLGRLRPGYGYGLLPDTTEGIDAPEDDGLFILDLETGETRLVVSLKQLSEMAGNSKGEHYINHATFSPDGKTISFFHLWLEPSKKRHVRLIVYHVEQAELAIMESTRSVSHYCWLDNKGLLVTTKEASGKRQITVYDATHLNMCDVFLMGKSDTHPMLHPKMADSVLCDSYPVGFGRRQYLYLFDLKERNMKEFAWFYSPPEFTGQVRCDLHPRWDREGDFLVVDTAARGVRKLAIVALKSRSAWLK